jgi:hypothetical protein
MSEYVVHFTKDIPGVTTAYDAQLAILGSREIRAVTCFGTARNYPALADTQRCACFSEVPLDRLDRIVARRSRYGVGFSQDFLVRAGGARVWYLDNYGNPAAGFNQVVNQYLTPQVDISSPIWGITPFVDFPGFYGSTEYRFEWEREWRVPGGLRFSTTDVAFLFIPEEYHPQARIFFDEAEVKNYGPSYRCPILDPLWSDDDVQRALANVRIPPPPPTPYTPRP